MKCIGEKMKIFSGSFYELLSFISNTVQAVLIIILYMKRMKDKMDKIHKRLDYGSFN